MAAPPSISPNPITPVISDITKNIIVLRTISGKFIYSGE